jgi:zinc transporter
LTAEPSYGSEQSGLIYGFLFAPGVNTRSIDTAGAIDWLESQGKGGYGGEFIWLHFNLGNANTEKWLAQHLSLPEEFFENLQQGMGSTHIEHAQNCLIATINDVSHDFSYEPSQIATMWINVDQKILISTRLHPLRSIERLRNAVRAGEEFHSTVALLAHLLRDQADVLIKIVRNVSATVDGVEDTLLTGRLNPKRVSLGSLRRLLVRLTRLLAPEPGALLRLLNRPPTWLESKDVLELRDASEEFSAVLNDLVSLQERTKLLQEELVGQTTEQTNRSVFLLTMVTVLALPINLIAGLLGMNVGGIPFSQNPHGFWAIIAIVASFTVAAGWYAFLKQREDNI